MLLVVIADACSFPRSSLYLMYDDKLYLYVQVFLFNMSYGIFLRGRGGQF